MFYTSLFRKATLVAAGGFLSGVFRTHERRKAFLLGSEAGPVHGCGVGDFVHEFSLRLSMFLGYSTFDPFEAVSNVLSGPQSEQPEEGRDCN